MKKIFLSFIVILLAATTAWGQQRPFRGNTPDPNSGQQIGGNIGGTSSPITPGAIGLCQVVGYDGSFGTIQEAIDYIAGLTDPTGTIELLTSNDEGAGFGTFSGYPADLNITIDFKGFSYVFGKDWVGSPGTENQCMHFEKAHSVTLKNSSTNPSTLSVKEGVVADKPRMMLQNYVNLTIDNLTIDCSNIVPTTYVTSSSPVWVGKTRPVFNFNVGTSYIKNHSTIIFSDADQWGVLADRQNATNISNVVIGGAGEYVEIQGNVTAMEGKATVAPGTTVTGDIILGSDNGDLSVAAANTLTIGGNVKSLTSTKTVAGNYQPVASIERSGEQLLFASLQTAIDSAKIGETIKVTADISNAPKYDLTSTELKNADNTNAWGSNATNYVSFYIPAGKDITIDLNGKTVSGTATNGFLNAGKLKLTDTATGGDGRIVSMSGWGIRAFTGSTTVVDGGSIESLESAILTGKSANATVTINGGTFSASDNAVIMDNGTSGCSGNTITINGGTFNGSITSTPDYVACGIYAANNDTWTINGGTFNITGGAGIVQRAGKVIIPETSTVEFNCTGNATGRVGDSRVVVPCSAIVYDAEANYPGKTTESVADIKAGTFKAASGVDAVSYVPDTATETQINISGGSFSSVVDEKFCAPSYSPVTEADAQGLFTVQVQQDVFFANASTLTLSTASDDGSLAAASTIISGVKVNNGSSSTDYGVDTESVDIAEGANVALTFTMNSGFSADKMTVTVKSLLTGAAVTTTENLHLKSDLSCYDQKTVTFTMPEGRAEVTLSYGIHEVTINTQDYVYDGNTKQMKVTSVIDETIDKAYIGDAATTFLENYFEKEELNVNQTGSETVDCSYVGGQYVGKVGTVYKRVGSSDKVFYADKNFLKKMPVGKGQTRYLRVGELTSDGTYYWNPENAADDNNGLATTATADKDYFKIEFGGAAQKGGASWGRTTDPTDASTTMTVKVSTLKADSVKIKSVALYDNFSGKHFANQSASATGDISGSLNMYTNKYREAQVKAQTNNYQAAASIVWTAAGSEAASEVTFTVDDAQRVHAVLIEYEKVVNVNDLVVTVDPLTYSGVAQTPRVVVKMANDTLTVGQDYTISYKSGDTPQFINAKEYVDEIIVTGKGALAGASLNASFTILPKNIANVSVTANAAYHNGEEISVEDNVSVTDIINNASQPLVKGTDYTITVNPTYAKVKDAGTYPGIITITAKEGGNYTGSVTKDFTVTNGLNIASALVLSKAVYNGKQQAPTPYSDANGRANIEVWYGSKLLTPNTDFQLTVNGNASDYKDAKTYSNAVSIAGKGEYSGVVNADFTIKQRNLNDGVTAQEESVMVWTGEIITPNINTDENNNISIAVDTTGYKLVRDSDFTYFTNPAPVKEVGLYTFTFEGRGNFTGTLTLSNVHVKKNFSPADIALAQNKMILGVNTDEIGDVVSLDTIKAADIPVMDGTDRLVYGTDYTADIYRSYDESSNTFTDSIGKIASDSIYWVKVKLNSVSETEPVAMKLYVLREYYDFDEESENGQDKNPAHIALHLTDTDNAMVTSTPGGHRCVPVGTDHLVIPDSVKVLCGADSVALRISGIEPDAFETADDLHWIDATKLPATFRPNGLDRSTAGTTFNGVAPQALVFLNGTTIEGENYVYYTGTGFQCAELKIYDDLSGTQTNIAPDGSAHRWNYENPYEFTAQKVTNTRMFSANYYYTTCLPYALTFSNNDFKAYTVEAASTKLIGFKEIEGNTLQAFTPYVLMPQVSGQMLSATNVTVPATADLYAFGAAGNEAATTLNAQQAGSTYQLIGTMRYMDGDQESTGATAVGKYILQSDKSWKQVQASESNTYSTQGACILPMRAYIATQTVTPSPARLMATYTDLDGSVTAVKDLRIDNEDNTLYDLQGRQLQNTQRRGVYIQNHRKVIIK